MKKEQLILAVGGVVPKTRQLFSSNFIHGLRLGQGHGVSLRPW